MRKACNYRYCMPAMSQIRNVPDDLHRALKARAALECVSLSDLLLNEIRRHLTAFDAAYVALAETLAATLVTRDARLAVAPRLRATIEVI